MEYPLDNAYGMALYSRLPLKESEIKFLKHDDVPSFHAKVVLSSGSAFKFHGMHPVAPVPSEIYPNNVGEEEVAFMKVGKLVASDPMPAIVAGDFNDVSWSHTSRLFGNTGNLKNARIGRGFYNSFNAQSLIMRRPLDHFFVSVEFALLELERLQKFISTTFRCTLSLYCRIIEFHSSLTSATAIRNLQDQGLEVIMLTGDNVNTAKAVAEKLGLNGFEAGLLPEDKHDKVNALQQQGKKVAMAGDGINDALAPGPG